MGSCQETVTLSIYDNFICMLLDKYKGRLHIPYKHDTWIWTDRVWTIIYCNTYNHVNIDRSRGYWIWWLLWPPSSETTPAFLRLCSIKKVVCIIAFDNPLEKGHPANKAMGIFRLPFPKSGLIRGRGNVLYREWLRFDLNRDLMSALWQGYHCVSRNAYQRNYKEYLTDVSINKDICQRIPTSPW